MKTAYQIQAVAKHPQLLEAALTELLGEWMSGRNRAVRRRRTVRVMLLCKRNSEEAVLPQIQGREAAIAFGKSASGAGRTSARWASGAHGRATRATLVRDIFILEDKLNVVRGGNTDVAALPIERRGLSPVRLRQPFFPHKDSSQKSRHCKTNWAS